MSSYEIPGKKDSHTRPTQPNEYFNDIPVILDKFTTLIERLPVHYRPARQTIEYEFLPRAADQLSYPRVVADHMDINPLTAVSVGIVQEEDQEPSTSFEFVFDKGAGELETIYASRAILADEETKKFSADPASEYAVLTGDDERDSVFSTHNATPSQINKIPNNELNSYLFSLTDNTIESMIAKDDPYGHNLVDATTMSEALSRSAIEETVDTTFELDADGSRILNYRIIKNGPKETLSSLFFQYETGSDKKISITIDQHTGFSIDFHTSDPETGINNLFQDEGDYVRLIEILDEEIAKLER